MLILIAMVAILSFALDVLPPDRVAFHGLHRWPIPHTCPMRAVFGFNCPGCGLTRSFVYLAHGQFRASVHMHPLGWVIAVALLLQIPYRVAGMLRPERPLIATWLADAFGWGIFGALIVNWLIHFI